MLGMVGAQVGKTCLRKEQRGAGRPSGMGRAELSYACVRETNHETGRNKCSVPRAEPCIPEKHQTFQQKAVPT